jgi:hypothetical protein
LGEESSLVMKLYWFLKYSALVVPRASPLEEGQESVCIHCSPVLSDAAAMDGGGCGGPESRREI